MNGYFKILVWFIIGLMMAMLLLMDLIIRACPKSHFFQNSFLDHENVNNFSENIQAFPQKCQLSEQL